MRLIILLILFVLPMHSFASIHLEPYIGFGNSNFTVDLSSDDESDDNSYKTMGAKLGAGILGFDAGVDYELDTDDDLSRSNLSLYAAFEFPILIRVWAEYGISSNLSLDKVDADLSFISGNTLGVGFTGLPFVHLNFEVENSKYEGDLDGTDLELNWVSYMASVSMPFDF